MNAKKINDFNLYSDPSNKSMRLPICFCIEASKETLTHVISEELNRFFQKISDDFSLASSVEIAIVTFAGNEFNIIRPFKPISSESVYIDEPKTEEPPDLNNALLKCIKLTQAIKCDYNNASLNYCQPSIILFSSGNYSEDITEVRSKIIGHKDKGTLKVYPMQIIEKNIDVLKTLSSDKKVYVSLDQTYSSLFDKIGKSMKRLSDSTSRAFDSLMDAAPEEWDRLIRM